MHKIAIAALSLSHTHTHTHTHSHTNAHSLSLFAAKATTSTSTSKLYFRPPEKYMDCKIDKQMHLLGGDRRRLLHLHENWNMMKMYFKDDDCFA